MVTRYIDDEHIILGLSQPVPNHDVAGSEMYSTTDNEAVVTQSDTLEPGRDYIDVETMVGIESAGVERGGWTREAFVSSQLEVQDFLNPVDLEGIYLGFDMSQEGVEGASRIQIDVPGDQVDKTSAGSDKDSN